MEKKEKWHAELNTSATRYCFVQGPPTFLSDFQVRHALEELEWRRALELPLPPQDAVTTTFARYVFECV